MHEWTFCWQQSVLQRPTSSVQISSDKRFVGLRFGRSLSGSDAKSVKSEKSKPGPTEQPTKV